MRQHPARLVAAILVLVAAGCVTNADRPVPPEPAAAALAAPPIADAANQPDATAFPAFPASPAAAGEGLPALDLSAPTSVVRVEAEAPRYAPPESLKKFRYAKAPVEKPAAKPAASAPVRAAGSAVIMPVESVAATEPVAAVAAPTLPAVPDVRTAPAVSATTPKAPDPAAPPTVRPTASSGGPTPALPPQAEAPAAELPQLTVPTVIAQPEPPRYKRPDSLNHWGSGRKVPLYADPDAAPWQADATEPRLQNAAVSCNYKDEGGVRGKAMLLVDKNKLTRFTARIEMPNGGVCQFDSKKMAQRPFEQGIALQAKDDECIVRMWEQKHRITIAAYSCHKQCSRGSFSYLWPIIMDTRVGTCY